MFSSIFSTGAFLDLLSGPVTNSSTALLLLQVLNIAAGDNGCDAACVSRLFSSSTDDEEDSILLLIARLDAVVPPCNASEALLIHPAAFLLQYAFAQLVKLNLAPNW